MYKLILFLLFTVLSLAVAIFVSWPSSRLRLIVCDVGQGDALLLQQGFSQILIDAGPPLGGVEVCLGRHMPFWDRVVEMVILTHGDADHMGGFQTVSQSYQIGSVVTGAHFTKELPQSQKRVVLAKGGGLSQGILKITTLWPPSEMLMLGQEENDTSLVLKLDYGSFSALLMGDVPVEIEQALIVEGVITPVSVLKVGHHGSKSSTSPEFLMRARPKLSLISVGKSNRYGHPNEEVLIELDRVGSIIYRTDIAHDIQLSSDGVDVRVDKP